MRNIDHRHIRLGNVLPAVRRSPVLARVGVAGAAFVALAVAIPEVAASAQAAKTPQAKPAAVSTINSKSITTLAVAGVAKAAVTAPVTPYTGTLVITKAGTLITGKSIKGSIEVLANNVRIEHSSLTSGNAVAIEIPVGITGTVVYSSTITCKTATGLASGPGALSASKMKTVGCAKPGTVTASPTPAPTGPTPAPTTATPAPTTPAPTSPAPTSPAPTRPAPTSPAPSSPAPTSPAPTSPAPSSPAPTTPAPTTPAGSNYTYVPMVTNMKPTAQMIPSVWPTASTTGVPAGTKLTASAGLSITVDGTVVSGLDIAGCLDIHASNVTIKNTRITCSRNTPAIRIYSGVSKLTVVDSEVNGQNSAPACIGYSNFILLRDNLHNCVDGINGSGDVVVEYTYVHDLSRLTGTHNDTFQTFGGTHMLLLGNNFQAYNVATSDPMNAAIQTGHLTSALVDVLVVGNMFDGGNYTVNAGANSTDGNAISGYVFSGNRFGHHARYGPISELGTGISFDQTNVWSDSGTAVH